MHCGLNTAMEQHFFVNSSTELALRMMKDCKDQYMWQPKTRVGEPNTFMGYPIYTNESINSIPKEKGMNLMVAAFGDPSYFVIKDTRKITMPNLYDDDEEAMKSLEKGLVGFKVHTKVNGKLEEPKAFVTLTVTT